MSPRHPATWDEIQEKLEKLETYEDILVAEGEADRGEVYTSDDTRQMMNDHIAKHISRQARRAAV